MKYNYSFKDNIALFEFDCVSNDLDYFQINCNYIGEIWGLLFMEVLLDMKLI